MRPIQALFTLFACTFLPLYAAGLDDLTWTTTNGKVTITDCNAAATGELVIPDIIGGNPVTSIGNYAFRDCASLTSITIPYSVTSIGAEAFIASSILEITIEKDTQSAELEAQLATVTAERDARPTQVAYDAAVETARTAAAAELAAAAPVITLLGNATITHKQDTPYTDAGATAIDSVDGDLTSSLVIVNTVDPTTTGVYALTYKARDSAGNTASVTRTVTVVAAQGAEWVTAENFGDPVIYPNSSATVYGVVTINDQPAEAGDVVGFFVGTELRFKGPVVIAEGGAAYVTGLMNAAGGNEVFTFKVYDESAKLVYPVPGISLTVGPGSTTGPTPFFEVKASSSWNGLPVESILTWTTTTDDEVTITDCKTTATGELVIPDTIGGNPVTSIGNDAFRDCRSLTSITIPKSVTSIGTRAFWACRSLTRISFFGTAPTVGANAFLEVAVRAEALVTIEALSSFSDFGTDWNGLTVSMSHSAMAAAAAAPVITLRGNATVTHKQGTPYTDAGATARDSVDGDLTSSLVIVNPVDPTTTGVYTLTYRARDSEGNTASVTRTVTVMAAQGAEWVTAENFGDPVIYPNSSATVYGVVTINDQPAEAGDVVGFFVGTELRFKGPVVIAEGGAAYVTGLMNAAGGNEVFTFKVYDESAKLVYPVPGISLTVGPGSTTGPTPFFEVKASSWNGLPVESILTWTTTTDGEVTITDCKTAATGELVIPDTIGGNPVTSIGDEAFRDCHSLSSITIPNSVTSIGTRAFWACRSLTRISFFGTAPTVGANAFLEVAVGAEALVTIEALSSFGDFGTDWNGLTVSMSHSAMNGLLEERDARPTQEAYNTVVNDAAIAAATAVTDATAAAELAAVELADAAAKSRVAGRTDVTGAPGSFNLTTIEAYNTVIAQRDARPTQVSYDELAAERDARFVDTDGDGITDVKEDELETNADEETIFYLAEAYDTIVADRDSRFVDADADGLTDVKEVELGSDAGEETVFFLKDAYDFAVNTSRLAGQADVTDAPAFFELFTTPQYDAIVADRDSRFVDSDADGLTDVKEDELETNADEETIFYLAEAYDTIVADRDSRFVDADADGLTDVKEVELGSDAGEETVFFLKDAYDFAVNISRLAGQADVTDAPDTFELFSRDSAG